MYHNARGRQRKWWVYSSGGRLYLWALARQLGLQPVGLLPPQAWEFQSLLAFACLLQPLQLRRLLGHLQAPRTSTFHNQPALYRTVILETTICLAILCSYTFPLFFSPSTLFAVRYSKSWIENSWFASLTWLLEGKQVYLAWLALGKVFWNFSE